MRCKLCNKKKIHEELKRFAALHSLSIRNYGLIPKFVPASLETLGVFERELDFELLVWFRTLVETGAVDQSFAFPSHLAYYFKHKTR